MGSPAAMPGLSHAVYGLWHILGIKTILTSLIASNHISGDYGIKPYVCSSIGSSIPHGWFLIRMNTAYSIVALPIQTMHNLSQLHQRHDNQLFLLTPAYPAGLGQAVACHKGTAAG